MENKFKICSEHEKKYFKLTKHFSRCSQKNRKRFTMQNIDENQNNFSTNILYSISQWAQSEHISRGFCHLPAPPSSGLSGEAC